MLEASGETSLGMARWASYAITKPGGTVLRNEVELGPLLDRRALRLISGWYHGRILDLRSGGSGAGYRGLFPLAREAGFQALAA